MCLCFVCSHYPKTSFTIVTDTPENLRLKQQTELQSQVGDWGGCDNILILDLTMCDLTLLSILQEPNRTHMECTLTLRDEV